MEKNINFDSLEIAVNYQGKNYTYRRMKRDILKLSFYLKKKIKKQEIICVALENSYFYIVLYLACFYNNYIIVPINKNSTPLDKKKIERLLKPRIFLKKEINLDKINCQTKEINNFNKQAPNSIFFSSGTTEKPKGIIHNYNSLSNAAKNFLNTINPKKKIKFFSFLPMSYMAGFLNSTLNILYAGGTIFCYKEFNFDLLKNFFKIVNEHKINTLWLTPTNIALINSVHRKQKNKYLKNIYVGMAALNYAEKQKFEKKFGVKCLESYGTSEALFVSCKKKASKDNSSGQLLKNINLKFFRKEIIVNSNSIMIGYFQNKKNLLNKKNLQTFKTGDIGYIKNKKLFITDRKKNIIIKGGENIFPNEIEQKIRKCSYVKDIAIVPKKDKILGEQICAAIIPYNEKKIQKIEDFITKNISSYYRPGITKFIKKFPINSSGKVIKKEIIKYFR